MKGALQFVLVLLLYGATAFTHSPYFLPRSRLLSLMAGDDFSADLIRYPTQLLPDEVEIKRLLGKIDVVSEKNQRETLMRVFEAVLGGKKAWLKEFLPASASLA